MHKEYPQQDFISLTRPNGQPQCHRRCTENGVQWPPGMPNSCLTPVEHVSLPSWWVLWRQLSAKQDDGLIKLDQSSRKTPQPVLRWHHWPLRMSCHFALRFTCDPKTTRPQRHCQGLLVTSPKWPFHTGTKDPTQGMYFWQTPDLMKLFPHEYLTWTSPGMS